MPRKRHNAEPVIGKLREAEVSLSGGQTVPAVCRTLGVSEQTYYRWRKECGGLKIEGSVGVRVWVTGKSGSGKSLLMQ